MKSMNTVLQNETLQSCTRKQVILQPFSANLKKTSIFIHREKTILCLRSFLQYTQK
ncbi:ASH1 like histone lysine methyltransferase [Phyllostomus discolor]|uniref:ASH1 like histone lysine methyltransferase n=1 Tax=Phyllostomus discolor TaxID=89673 RepID=A0A833YGR5_9CHIR|nr:ASH1 like histone lysine methyltransferase [Phyllostomus discolor]